MLSFTSFLLAAISLAGQQALAQDPTVTPAPTTPAAPPAQATFPATRLAAKGPFAYPAGIPYKVDTDTHLIRGPQHGYNICNSTTEGQTSLCQTSWFNGLDDFCLWGPPELGREVGDVEGIMVAYCSKPGHGTRLIPAGALTGVQFIKTPDYIQVVGNIDQTQINIMEGDWGGEMDPHGADGRGNPMGGIVYSDNFTGSPVQVIQWHNFIGGNRFCLKLCDGSRPNDRHFCEHIYDRIGIDYNCPTSFSNEANTFEACEGENQDFPGTYTLDGVVHTYTQPDGSITSVYPVRTPAVSNCQTFASSELFSALPTGTSTRTTSARTTGTNTRVTTSPRNTGTNTGTGTDGDAQPSQTGGAPATFQLSFGFVSVMVLSFVSGVVMLA